MSSKRIKEKDLYELCKVLNQLTESPLTPYSKDESGKLQPNAGHYGLEGAYGGWRLERFAPRGGCETPLGGGYCTKRELYNMMSAYIWGLGAGSRIAKESL